MDADRWAIEVSTTDLVQSEVAWTTSKPLQGDQVLVAIDHLALTANVMTYAGMANELGFWSLFPASLPGRGCIPAWGYASVVESRLSEIAPGERLFGLLPMASHAILAGRSSRLGLRETSERRRLLNPVYNQYATHAAAEPGWRELKSLFHPLFITAFVLAHHLSENAYFGADEVAIISASSKTALGTAHLISGARRLIGFTSTGNAGWLAGTGLYNDVVAYDDPQSLGAKQCLVIDFSGNGAIVDAVASRLGSRCAHIIRVGATHGGPIACIPDSPVNRRDETFSGPGHIERRSAQWGALEFDRRLSEALALFTSTIRPLFQLRHADGPKAVLAAYRQLQRGDVPAWDLLVARPVPGVEDRLDCFRA